MQNINCLQAATHRFEGNKMQLKLGLTCWFCFLSLENLELQGTNLLLFKNTQFPAILESVTAKNNRITFLLSYCWFLIFPKIKLEKKQKKASNTQEYIHKNFLLLMKCVCVCLS